MGIATIERVRVGETAEDKRDAELALKLKAWAAQRREVITPFLSQQLSIFAKANGMEGDGYTIEQRNAYIFSEAKIWDTTVLVRGPLYTTIAFMVWLERAPKESGNAYLICFTPTTKSEGQ